MSSNRQLTRIVGPVQRYEESLSSVKAAVMAGEAQRLEELLVSAPPGVVNLPFEEATDPEETLLLMAAGAGHLEVVRVLLKRGARVNYVSTRTGKTAVLAAVLAGHVSGRLDIRPPRLDGVLHRVVSAL